MANILIIDDEINMCMMLKAIISDNGHRADYAHTIKDGCEKASSAAYDIVFLDIHLPDGNGLEYLALLRSTSSNPEVIIITGEGDETGAEIAIKNGAWDYLKKPFSKVQIDLQIARALQYRQGKKSASPAVVLKREEVIGESPSIMESLKLVAQAAHSDITVLITGATGTGKECFAATIHENSNRAKGNFVIVDCAALPATLVESTLFGHVKGAFTGADRDQDGLIKQADAGTLFLDEIGELPMSVQKTFLRVLQEHTFRPVGGKKEITSDFRLIAATNRDLSSMVNHGTFREDLLFRIKALTIALPLLKDRREDIKDLAVSMISKICVREGIGIKGFSPEFISTLEAYQWPGNVRELINTLDWAISAARNEPTLFPKHLPDQIRISVTGSHIAESNIKGKAEEQPRRIIPEKTFPSMKDFRESILAEHERNYLNALFEATGGDIKEACRISGLGRARLYELMKNYQISTKFINDKKE